jgi:hypothetical protein
VSTFAVRALVTARAAALLPRTGVRARILAGCVGFVAGVGWLATGSGGYLTGVLGPTLLVAAGIGLVFPSLMAAATADAADGDAGTVGGLASTASQVGGSVGLAVLTAVAGGSSYGRVFLVAAGIGVALAAASVLLPGRRGEGFSG